MDCSPPGSPVHRILQTRILGWVTMPFSRGSSWPGDPTHISFISSTGRQILYHCTTLVQFSSFAQFVPDSVKPHGLQHARLPCPPLTPRACSNSCPWSWWRHPTILSSVITFSSPLQSFPTSGSFQMSQFFPSGGQSTGVSASASVLPMNIQDWYPLGWTSWISLQSKGLSRVFSNITVQKLQFFSAPLSL